MRGMLKIVKVVVSVHGSNRAYIQFQLLEDRFRNLDLGRICLVLVGLNIKLGQRNDLWNFSNQHFALVHFLFHLWKDSIKVLLVGGSIAVGNHLLEQFLEDFHIPANKALNLWRQGGFKLIKTHANSVGKLWILHIGYLGFQARGCKPVGLKFSLALSSDNLITLLDPVLLSSSNE